MPEPEDAWAGEFDAANERAQERWRIQQDHRMRWWSGFAFTVGGIAACAMVAALGWWLYLNAQDNHARNVELERERTAQVQACLELGDLAERQLCIAVLGVDGEDDGA